jgi:Glycosyl hydrolase family 26
MAQPPAAPSAPAAPASVAIPLAPPAPATAATAAPPVAAGNPVAAAAPVAAASPATALAPTAGRVKLGAFSQYAQQTNAASVASLERSIGRKLSIDNHYYDWSDNFPASGEQGDVSAGRIPMISWWGTSYAKVLDGSQDATIRARAASLKAFGHPVYLRWAAEFNGDWFAWGGPQNGKDPSAFVRAWQHIHDIFTAAGVTNVAWVWAPNADSHPGGIDRTSWNNWRNYYPGDAYVDWVGIDGYNSGSRFDWQAFSGIMNPVYSDYAGRKPIMIAETSSVESGGDKAAWITSARSWIKSHSAISALVWFDTDQSSTKIDWRVGSSTASQAAFTGLAQDPYFGG